MIKPQGAKAKEKMPGRWSTLPMDVTSLVLLWLVGVFIHWSDVRKQTKDVNSTINLQHVHLPKRAEFLFNRGQHQAEHTDQKAKHLLGLSSALATLLVVFAPDVDPGWLVLPSLVALLFSVLLSVTILGVRVEMIPEPESLDSDPEGSQWARDILTSYLFNRNRHLFLVDLFAASRRWLIVALSLFLVILAQHRSTLHPLAEEVSRLQHTVQNQLDTLNTEVSKVSEAVENLRDVMTQEEQHRPPEGGDRQ